MLALHVIDCNVNATTLFMCKLPMVYVCTTLSTCCIAVCSHPTPLPTLQSSPGLRERFDTVYYTSNAFVSMFNVDVGNWCCLLTFYHAFLVNCSQFRKSWFSF